MIRFPSNDIARHRSRQGAFTLVELVIVLAILALLMALLLPAITGAFRNARVVEVKAEISRLETAIAAFNAQYGMDPPSTITLSEDGAAWGAQAKAVLIKMFPQMSFTLDHDFNADGDMTDTITLNGSECLVMFLGGVVDSNGTFTGFSKLPADPFAVGGNRTDPFFEFDLRRIQPSINGALWYLDPIPNQVNPYVYVSSYGGRGYRTEAAGTGLDSWPLVDVYRTGPFVAMGNQPAPYKAQSYQIISPGADTFYGPTLSSAAAMVLPAEAPWSGAARPGITIMRPARAFGGGGGHYDPDQADILLSGDRAPEADNITNFSDGMLRN